MRGHQPTNEKGGQPLKSSDDCSASGNWRVVPSKPSETRPEPKAALITSGASSTTTLRHGYDALAAVSAHASTTDDVHTRPLLLPD